MRGTPSERETHGTVILGLTGSLGSGKSFVSSLIGLSGAAVICADEIAREELLPGTESFGEVVAQFGPNIVGSNGRIDRAALATIVFSHPAKRQLLESILHPRIRARELRLLDDLRGKKALVVLDVPLLFEGGLDQYCNHVLVVWVEEQVRRDRLHLHRGMSAEQVEARLAAQMPQSEKISRADFLVNNSGTRPETVEQINGVLRALFPHQLPSELRFLDPSSDQLSHP